MPDVSWTVSGPATVTLHLADKRASVDGVARIHGDPAAGAMVLLVPATLGMAGDLNTIERDETNTDGSFRMTGVTPGEYILVAIDHGWNVDLARSRDDGAISDPWHAGRSAHDCEGA